MPAPSPDDGIAPAAIVARLRAAGCVFAEEEAQMLVSSAPDPGGLRRMIAERESGLPLEHVVGWAEFCGLRLVVDRGVFVPRRRSELLVRSAAALCPAGATAPVVVDLACGCGAIGAAIAALVPGAQVHACDLDRAAVRCAVRNLDPVGGRVYIGDLYEALPAGLRGRVSVIAANVPYVPTGALSLMPAEARLHEPRAALDGGQDGLEVARRAAAGAGEWLAPGGYLLIETSDDQLAAATAMLAGAGLVPSRDADTDLGATVVIGRSPHCEPARPVSRAAGGAARPADAGRGAGANSASIPPGAALRPRQERRP